MARTRNMRMSPRKYMGKIPLRISQYGFKVSVTADEVDAFADNWPASGLRGRGGFSAEFDSRGDLVDLTGWPSEYGGERGYDFDASALSALIDDMKAYGQRKAGTRKSNPGRGNRNRTRARNPRLRPRGWWARAQRIWSALDPASRWDVLKLIGKYRRGLEHKPWHKLSPSAQRAFWESYQYGPGDFGG